MKTRCSKWAVAMATIVAALLVACSENPESMLKSAKESLGKNERGAAVIQLRDALQKNPDLGEARFLLGKSLLETGDIPGAEKELRKARELKYSPDEVVPALANLLLRRGEYKKVIDEFGTTTLSAPQAKAALNAALGQAHQALGNAELAKDRFETALVLVPDFPPVLIAQARMAAAAGDLPGAFALIDRALAKAPTLSEGWSLKGDLLSAQRQNDEALVAYRKAVETNAYNLMAHYMAVSLLIQQGKTEEAGKQLEAMRKVAADYPETLYLQALLAFRQQNYTAARSAIQQNLKFAPDNPVGLLLSARVNYQLQAYTQTEAELRKLLQQFPKHREARRLLIQTYLRMQQPGKALDAVAPVLAETDLDAETTALIGEVYARNGDIAKASNYLEKAVKVDPKNTPKRTALALVHMDSKGQSDRGFKELEEAAAADTDIQADVILILASLRQKKFDAALAAVAALEKKQPENPQPYNLRGGVLLAKGDSAGARKSFEQALAKDPGYFPAAGNLARLDLADKKPEDARRRFDAVLAKDPQNVQALLSIAGLSAQAGGSTDEVAKLIRRAIAADAADPAPRLALIGHYIKSNEPKLAVVAAQEALSAQPDRPEILDAAAKAYLVAGDTNQALETYAKRKEILPTSTTPMMRVAELQFAMNDNAGAIESLRKVLREVPTQRIARRMLVQAYLRTDQPRKAMETMTPLLDAKDMDADTLAVIGEVYGLNGDMAKASSYIEKAVKLDPTSASKRTALAIAHMGNKADADRGYRELEEAAASDSGTRADVTLITANVQRKQFDAALAAVAALEKKQPENPLPYDLRGAVLLAKGDAAGARKSFEQALAKDPGYFPAASNLARLDLADKRPADARKRFEAILAKDPKNVQALLSIAGLSAQTGGSTEEVATLIGKAIAAAPTETKPRLALIGHYIKSKEPKLAVAAAQEALTAQPDRPEIMDAAARAHFAAGDTKQALSMYSRLTRIDPTSTLPLMRSAELQMATKDNAAALDSLKKALAIQPDLLEAQRMKIMLDLDASRTEEAISMAREIQKQRPTESVGFLLEGSVLARQKAWAQAATAYRNGLKQVGLKQVGTSDLAVGLYSSLRSGGTHADAEKFAVSWLKEHPNDVNFRNYLAESALIRKDFAVAAKQYKTVLEFEQNNFVALNNLARAAGQLKDPKALEYAEQAAKLAPSNPEVLDTLGVLLAESGHIKRGIELLQKAVSLAPDAAAIRLNLARALVKDGQKVVAKKELDVLAKLGDKFGDQGEVAKLMQGL